MLHQSKFVKAYYDRNFVAAIESMNNLKTLYEPDELQEMESRLYEIMGSRFDMVHGSPRLEQLYENREFMGRILDYFAPERSGFFRQYYSLQITMKYGIGDNLLNSLAELESQCPKHMKRNYYLFLMTVAGNSVNLELLNHAIESYEELNQ